MLIFENQLFLIFIGGLNKPITIMAKDPNTGAMRPVTLYPKNVTKNPGGITTIQLAPNPSNIKIATGKEN